MKGVAATAICMATLIVLTGCSNTNNGENSVVTNEKLLSDCIPSNLYTADQIVFLGPVSYTVGDVWRKSGSGNSTAYQPMYQFSQIAQHAVSKPGPNMIGTNGQIICNVSLNNGKSASVSLGGDAKILTALPLSASAAAHIKNSQVRKITFTSLQIEQVNVPGEYRSMYESIPNMLPERANVDAGAFYWAVAMIKVTDYAVSVTATTDNGIDLGASATLPTTLSGNLHASVNVSKTGNNEYEYKIPGPVYIAAIMRPFGSDNLPQSESKYTGDPSHMVYVAPPAERGSN